MKPELQIKALAELDGYTWSTSASDSEWCWRNNKAEYVGDIPDYLNSYDAIIPLIQKQIGITEETVNHGFIGEFWYKLNDLTDFFEKGGHTYMLAATPAQLCEALLRATNKWIEL